MEDNVKLATEKFRNRKNDRKKEPGRVNGGWQKQHDIGCVKRRWGGRYAKPNTVYDTKLTGKTKKRVRRRC